MLTFRRMSNGMLVAAPRLWPFASPQHYIATKAQLTKIEARTWIVDLAYGFPVFVLLTIALVVGDQTGVGGTSWFLNLYSLAVIAVAAGSQIVTGLAVRQLLASLPRSNEHITFGERARMTAASAPLVAAHRRRCASCLPDRLAGARRFQPAGLSLQRRYGGDWRGVVLGDRLRWCHRLSSLSHRAQAQMS
jgi:hypothetical protein